MKPFLILEAGRLIDALRRHGSFGHGIRVAAGLHGREVRPAPQARRVLKRFIHLARRRG